MNVNAIQEASLEFARVCVLAAIPIMIDGLTSGKFDWKLIGITAAIAGLRWIDKYLHTLGKDEGIASLVTGLTRF